MQGGPSGERAAGVVAHRGACGYRPENTIAAFELAVALGAESIELDVVPTKDGALIARHENELSRTTDVAVRGEFADRRTTRVIDNKTRSGWFSEDFTLVEVKRLRTRERMRATRAANHQFDGRYPVPTLDEVLTWAARVRTASGRRVGIYVETKHSTYFRSIGLPLEEAVAAALHQSGYGDPGAPVWIESAEVTNLQQLALLGEFRLIQLVRCAGRPQDLRSRGDGRRYCDLVTPRGLREIGRYAFGVGLCKDVAIPRDAGGRLLRPTPVIRNAHRSGLVVLGWTFRRENRYLPTQFRLGADPYAPGDLTGELAAFLDAGLDGVFTDHPDVGRDAFRLAAPVPPTGKGTAAGLWGRLRR